MTISTTISRLYDAMVSLMSWCAIARKSLLVAIGKDERCLADCWAECDRMPAVYRSVPASALRR